jgi:hypothetical protein
MPNRNTERRQATRKALGRMSVSGPSTEEGTAVTQAQAWGWLTRFRRCLSRGGAEAISEERREESKEKEASCWEVQGSGEEDQPNLEPQVEKTSKRLAAKAPSEPPDGFRSPRAEG